ncbi:hypothetical protein B0T20DRAFT_461384 [Sordaria brevicollis]|uniref:2EXR domain-containing protein n=1 Tax=Sordaria brevicollis TaxID=83679 RepID=A0AAE0UCI9_SORBR|nr:hypothetical protein B0T20DRAFT_461384 [Sordaria brevicollis]
MATTFHPFPLLPWELRALIWEHTVEPRTVNVHAKKYRLDDNKSEDPAEGPVYVRLVSATPVPAVLHACHEARDMGLYQKGLSEVEVVPEGGESRYLWVNFDIDTIDFGEDDLFNYQLAADSVKRLRCKRPRTRGPDVTALNNFQNLIEAHIDCVNEDGLDEWYSIFEPWNISCDRRNIHLIQSENNNCTITFQALEEEIERRQQLELEEFLAEHGDAEPVSVSEMFAGLDLSAMMPMLQQIGESLQNMEDDDNH